MSDDAQIRRSALWMQVCAEHLRRHPDGRLHRLSGSSPAQPDLAQPAWRDALAHNRRSGDDVPRGWLRIYYQAVLMVFDEEPTARVGEVRDRFASLYVELENFPGLNIDVWTERMSRTTCSICGSAGRTVQRTDGAHVTRCPSHVNADPRHA